MSDMAAGTIEERINKVIDRLIALYKINPDRWKAIGSWKKVESVNERLIHYEFFKLLFEAFTSDEIKEHFKWEYRVGPPRPQEQKRPRPSELDIVITVDSERFVAIEIENVKSKSTLQDTLKERIETLRDSHECRKYMLKGYVIPFIESGQAVSKRSLDKLREEEIKNHPIEIIDGGLRLS